MQIMKIDTKWLILGGIVAAVLGALVTALLSGFFTIRAKQIPEPRPPTTPAQSTGSIQHPSAGETVGRSFIVSGELGEIPKDYHIWIGIEIGALLWPKEPEVSRNDRRFSIKIVEGGNPPNGRFSLTLFQVFQEGHQNIANWIETGRNTGEWPGLDVHNLIGFSQLDRVDDLRLW
jgi:hypothetical protein